MNSYTRNYNFGYHSNDDWLKGNNNHNKGELKMPGFWTLIIVRVTRLKSHLTYCKGSIQVQHIYVQMFKHFFNVVPSPREKSFSDHLLWYIFLNTMLIVIQLTMKLYHDWLLWCHGVLANWCLDNWCFFFLLLIVYPMSTVTLLRANCLVEPDTCTPQKRSLNFFLKPILDSNHNEVLPSVNVNVKRLVKLGCFLKSIKKI